MNRPIIILCVVFAMLTLGCSKMSSPTQSRQSPQQAQRFPAGKAVEVDSDHDPAVSAAESGDEGLTAVSTADTGDEPLNAVNGTESGVERMTWDYNGTVDEAIARFNNATETILEPRHHGSNHPPTMNQHIQNFNRVLLFPRGPAALLEFAGEPGSDPDADELSYSIAFAVFNMTGIQTPEEALMRTSRDGNRFRILPDGEITPAEFTAVYGDHANISGLQSAIRASDGTAESDYEVFNLNLAYDASAQFSAPAEYVSDQRWEYPDAIGWYEGAPAPVGGAFPTWTGVTAGQRNWVLDRAPGTIRCEILTFSGFYSFDDGGEDNNLFAVESETRSTSGTVRLSFNSPADFEAPGDEDGDNVYRLRVVNRHDINNINLEGSPTGCSGSVLDLAIRVRDVGVPAPPAAVSADFVASDDAMLAVNWNEPGGFFENGSLVPFPEGFEVEDYDYRYRPLGETSWHEEVDEHLSDTSTMIGGLTELAYEVQVRANNREGSGAWSPVVEVRKLTHTVCFGATQYTTQEGDPDGVEIEVHLDPAAGSLPVTVPIEIEEENGTGPDDYTGVPSSVTFEPGESVEAFSVIAFLDDDQDVGSEDSIRITFVDLPDIVSTESPASAEVVLEDATPNTTIVGLRISSTPEQESFYDRGETIEIEVVFSEPVEVLASNRPYLWLGVDHPGRRIARYSHGTGTERLYFQYRVRLHDFDTNGVGVESGEIEAPNGAITTVSSGLTADLYQNGLPDDPNHKVDGCL